MGLKEWSEKTKADAAARNVRLNAKTLARKEMFEGVVLTPDEISYKNQIRFIKGGRARVEAGADAQQRVTATRLVALGVFAFAAKKTLGSVYLIVEHPDYSFVVEVPAKKEAEAREFAAKINSAAL